MSFRRIYFILVLWLAIVCGPLEYCIAQAANPEDEDIPDEDVPAVPAQPQPPAPVEPPPAEPITPEPVKPEPVEPEPVTPPATNGSIPDETANVITVPRAEWEAMKARQDALERQIEELRQLAAQKAVAPVATPIATPQETPSPEPQSTATPAPVSGSNRSLLLPDISLTMTGKGFLSSDRRDPDRNRLFLDEAELSIQGYVYPNVKADAYIVAHPGEGESFGLEEGYLTFLGLRKNLNVVVGRKFAPFGRTGEQHPHSWLYSRQLIPRRNLVAGENLTGDGVLLRYRLPTRGKLFANLDVGAWDAAGHAHGEEEHDGEHEEEDPHNEFLRGPGAAYEGTFYTTRLWMGYPLGRNSELELGTSYARGHSVFSHDGHEDRGRVGLSGLDFSYRRFLSGDKRLLLRTEYFRHRPGGGLPTRSTSGYYGLANYRLDKFRDIGLLYERSDFPQAPGARESALSLILTKQFTEQFYVRLQGTRGRRPGEGGYNEAILQFTWGLGPHTHTLE